MGACRSFSRDSATSRSDLLWYIDGDCHAGLFSQIPAVVIDYRLATVDLFVINELTPVCRD
jgi:hypothetical protein